MSPRCMTDGSFRPGQGFVDTGEGVTHSSVGYSIGWIRVTMCEPREAGGYSLVSLAKSVKLVLAHKNRLNARSAGCIYRAVSCYLIIVPAGLERYQLL